MRGKRAKRARKDKHARSVRELNTDKIISATTAVLAANVADLSPARSVQTPLGWLRAVMAQCRAIAILAQNGQADIVTPNRRSASELLLRLQWLAAMDKADRPAAIDALIEEEKRQQENKQLHVLDMGLVAAPPIEDLDTVITNSGTVDAVRSQAKAFTEAAKTAQSAGVYLWWHRNTKMTHATMQLAVALAPETGGRLKKGSYPAADNDLKLVLEMATFSTVFASWLFHAARLNEGQAFRYFNAFFNGNRKGL